MIRKGMSIFITIKKKIEHLNYTKGCTKLKSENFINNLNSVIIPHYIT